MANKTKQIPLEFKLLQKEHNKLMEEIKLIRNEIVTKHKKEDDIRDLIRLANEKFEQAFFLMEEADRFITNFLYTTIPPLIPLK